MLFEKYKRIFGYARVSTLDQDLYRQIKNLKDFYEGIIIYKEKSTGTKMDRLEFMKLVGQLVDDKLNGGILKQDDLLVVDSISRFGRNKEECSKIYFLLMEKGVDIIFLKDRNIDTRIIRGELERAKAISLSADIKGIEHLEKFIREVQKGTVMARVENAFFQSEQEAANIRKNVRDGIARARAAGKVFGGEKSKGKTLVTKKSKEMKSKIIKMDKTFEGNMKSKEVIEILGLARGTYFKYKKEIKAEGLK